MRILRIGLNRNSQCIIGITQTEKVDGVVGQWAETIAEKKEELFIVGTKASVPCVHITENAT